MQHQLAVGSWQLAVGSWQLAVGSWQLAVGSGTALQFTPHAYTVHHNGLLEKMEKQRDVELPDVEIETEEEYEYSFALMRKVAL
ncbi:hypothetical protein L2E82_44800 [Cichorium intybus]|uniref:Uncharacterized protein n=1 Tax=Cichorium intybus TaxID=13427 RepID=A0ACB8ZS74_CICIN|nr:hypothetical protein L2E82_44800 [Cichorium intybus]